MCIRDSRWTSSTPSNTSSTTGPVHHCNINKQIGCIDACALVLPSEKSHKTRAPDFVSGLQPRQAPRMDASLQHYRPPRRHPRPVQARRSSLVARQDVCHTATAAQYIVRFLDDPGPVKLKLSPSRYTTAIGAERDSWCLQTRQGRPLQQGILRNIDESRGVELADSVATN